MLEKKEGRRREEWEGGDVGREEGVWGGAMRANDETCQYLTAKWDGMRG